MSSGVGWLAFTTTIASIVVDGRLLDRDLASVFIAVLLTCLGAVACLALALERSTAPRANDVGPP